MNTKQTFSNSFKDYSYWIDTEPSETSFCTDLPRKAGLVIIGSGYTGLNVALETADAVLTKEELPSAVDDAAMVMAESKTLGKAGIGKAIRESIGKTQKKVVKSQ